MFSLILITLCLSPIVTFCNNVPSTHIEYRRTTNTTCADPSLTEVYFEGYNQPSKVHNIELQWWFASVNTDLSGGWQVEAPIFRAWHNPQDSTVPLYQLKNTAGNDIMYLTSTTGSPPVVPGFSLPTIGIVAYVYPTQICGSVPLYGVVQQTASDHWYTTDSTQRDLLVNGGWVDLGIIAYVLPLDFGTVYSSSY